MTILECGNQIRLSKEEEKALKALAARAGNVIGDIKTWDDLWEAIFAGYAGDDLIELAALLGVPMDDLEEEPNENDEG